MANDYIWPAEAGFTPDMTTRAVKEAMTEMLQSGTTTLTICIIPMVWILKDLSGSENFQDALLFHRLLFLQGQRQLLRP